MLELKSTGSQYDSPTKNQVIGAVKSGSSIAEAARMVGMPGSTARSLVRKFREIGTTSNIRRSGRPSKLSDCTERVMVRKVKKARRMPLKQLGARMEPPLSE